ncbi:SusD family protein [gut metagenome]|uniref:SusD family protein n=1 Tax=gut metagenome TaxID=749906 RepID=J9DCG5_9ZZZZ
MKNIKTYLLLAILACSTTSCLDKYPEDMVPTDQAITTVNEADQAVIGIYSAFLNNALYSGYLTLLPDIQADLAYAVNGYSNQFGNTWRWNILGTDSEFEAVYAGLYEVITRANFLLDNIDRVKQNTTRDEDLDRLDQYCGEAYFARALAYSELIKLYCKTYDPATAANELGVVLKSHYEGDEPIRRASLEASYQFVLDDIEKASQYLKLEKDFNEQLFDSPYFNEYVVHALHARVALYMQNWKEAEKYATKIIESGFYRLANVNQMMTQDQNEYQYMWSNDRSFETIWKVGMTISNHGGALGQIFFNYDFHSFKPDYVPAAWVLNLYTQDDLRMGAFFVEQPTGYPHGLKWPLVAKYFGNEQFIAQNMMHVCMPKVFRLSEQYLIRAEARSQQGNYSGASKDLSDLRRARFKGGNGKANVTEKTWLQAIEEERVRELYMEGFRLQDLKRWHKGFSRKPQSQSLANGSSLKIEKDDVRFVWPIPQHEIEAPGSEIQPNESNK